MEVMRYKQNAVPHCNSAQRNEANKTGYGERLLGKHKREDAANKGRGQSIEYLSNNSHGRKQNHEYNEHADRRNRRKNEDDARRMLLAFELPAVLDKVSFRQCYARRHAILNLGNRTRQVSTLRVA